MVSWSTPTLPSAAPLVSGCQARGGGGGGGPPREHATSWVVCLAQLFLVLRPSFLSLPASWGPTSGASQPQTPQRWGDFPHLL